MVVTESQTSTGETKMAVLSPTRYGPVGQQTGAGTTEVNSQTQGSLTGIVLQPSEESPMSQYGQTTYVEIWKGPYGVLKDLPTTKMQPGYSRDAALATVAQVKTARFTPPNPGSGNSWWILSCRVRQEKAGDHATMQVTYSNVRPSWAFDKTGFSEDERQATWTLDWEAYVCQPSFFCANPASASRTPIDDPHAESHEAKSASYAHVQELMHYQVVKGGAGGGKGGNWNFAYRLPSVEQSTSLSATTYTLNGNERSVYQKMQSQVAAVYHRPVLTYVTVDYYSSLDPLNRMPEYPHSIGNGMDVIEDSLPAGCPYGELSDWEWLKTGDHMDTHFVGNDGRQIKYVRQQVWKGAGKWDVNFYGKDIYASGDPSKKRWTPAGL